MEDWEKESALQRAREDIFMETLSDIMDYYKDSEGEWTTGCGGAGAPLKRQPRNWEWDGSRPSQRRIGKHDRRHSRFCVPLPHPTLTCLPACSPHPHSQASAHTEAKAESGRIRAPLSSPLHTPSIEGGSLLCARLAPAQGCGVESEATCSVSQVPVVAAPVRSYSTVDTPLGCLVLLLLFSP